MEERSLGARQAPGTKFDTCRSIDERYPSLSGLLLNEAIEEDQRAPFMFLFVLR